MEVDIRIVPYNANSWVHPRHPESGAEGPAWRGMCTLTHALVELKLEKILFLGNKWATLDLGGFLQKCRLCPNPLSMSSSSP